MQMSEEMKREVVEFQQLQQQMQMVAMQKQQLLIQVAELDKALEEVRKGDGKFYRFIGSVLVPKEKAGLEKELVAEKESLELRKNVFQKQEDKVKERLTSLQKKFKQFSDAEGGFEGEGAEAN